MEEIKLDNVKFFLAKNLFDEQFSSFVKSLVESINNVSEQNKLEIAKLAIMHFLIVEVRSKNKTELKDLYKLIVKILAKNPLVIEWFITAISNEHYLR